MKRLATIINTMATRIAEMYAHRVTDQGTVGNYTYKKYADGTAEVWVTGSHNVAITTAAENVYRNASELTITSSDMPITFTEKPTWIAQIEGTGNYTAWLCISTAGTESAPPKYYLFRASSTSARTYYINLHAIGKVGG